MEARVYRVYRLQSACAGGNPQPQAVIVVGDYVVYDLKNPAVYKGHLHKFLRERDYATQTRLIGKTILPDWVARDTIPALYRYGNNGVGFKKLIRQHIKHLVPKRL